MAALENNIKQHATSLGFSTVGFAPALLGPENAANLQEFLEKDYHGTMEWLAEKASVRASPTTLMPEAKTAIVLGMNYGPDSDPMALLNHPDRGILSVYARNEDYHDVMKKRAKQLARWLVETHGGEVKVFVDTAPVMEKPLAALAGLGWQGKHTCIVSREYGSWLFLAVIYTTLALAPDAPEPNHCGSCTNCLDICPTQAFPFPGKIDARRCISYLTIEHKGHIAREFREPMQNRIYGCDDCLAVCPWNKFAKEAQETAFHAREELKAPELADLLTLDDTAFRALFRRSPVKRIGRDRFIRNVLIAVGNSGDPAHIPQIELLLGDPSPLVRAMAVWAMGKLVDEQRFKTLRSHRLGSETNAQVMKEWLEN